MGVKCLQSGKNWAAHNTLHRYIFPIIGRTPEVASAGFVVVASSTFLLHGVESSDRYCRPGASTDVDPRP